MRRDRSICSTIVAVTVPATAMVVDAITGTVTVMAIQLLVLFRMRPRVLMMWFTIGAAVATVLVTVAVVFHGTYFFRGPGCGYG